jgi:hypothetical protein
MKLSWQTALPLIRCVVAGRDLAPGAALLDVSGVTVESLVATARRVASLPGEDTLVVGRHGQNIMFPESCQGLPHRRMTVSPDCEAAVRGYRHRGYRVLRSANGR